MSQVSPTQIFQEVSNALPADCRENIVIIGSLAAGYHFFGDDASKTVRTKDIDCVLEPFNIAVQAGETIATQLLSAGWQRSLRGAHQEPGKPDTPADQLPAIRLYPPDVDPNTEEAWFIEFLTVPQNSKSTGKEWTRLTLPQGDFGLPTFRFLSLTAYDPLRAANLGIRYARPELMALANMLAHPGIGPETMSAPIAGQSIKRANKDLGRVLAITILADLDDYRPWAQTWQAALKSAFPDDWKIHALNAGSGIRELLSSPSDLNEALHTCNYGLLNSHPTNLNGLIAAGQRLEADAIQSLEESARM
jgi:hypothetical protein